MEGYQFYFNYELNTKTWRNFVNKHILQTYQRLSIEKHLREVKKQEKALKEEIEEVDRQIRSVNQEKTRFKEA